MKQRVERPDVSRIDHQPDTLAAEERSGTPPQPAEITGLTRRTSAGSMPSRRSSIEINAEYYCATMQYADAVPGEEGKDKGKREAKKADDASIGGSSARPNAPSSLPPPRVERHTATPSESGAMNSEAGSSKNRFGSLSRAFSTLISAGHGKRADRALKKDPDRFLRTFDTSKLTESKQTKLAFKLASSSPASLSREIEKLSIQSEQARAALAHTLIEETPQLLALNIDKFQLSLGNRLSLAQRMAELDSRYLCLSIGKFDLPDDDRAMLANVVASKVPKDYAHTVRQFDLTPDARFRTALQVAQEDPLALAKRLDHFEIGAAQLPQLCIAAARGAIASPDFMANPEGSDHRKQGMPFRAMKAVMEYFTSASASNPLDCGSLLDSLGHTGGHESGIVGALTHQLKQMDATLNPLARRKVEEWLVYTALRLGGKSMSSTDTAALVPVFEEVLKLPLPQARPFLTDLVLDNCIRREGDAERLASFLQAGAQPARTAVFAIPLFDIYRDTLDDPGLGQFRDILGHNRLLHGKKRFAIMNSLVAIAATDKLDAGQKQVVLAACMPPDGLGAKERAARLAESVKLAGAYVTAMDQDPNVPSAIATALAGVKSADGLRAMSAQVLQHVLGMPPSQDPKSDSDKVSRHLEQSRMPDALITYTVRAHGLNDSARAQVLDAVQQFVKATVFDDDPDAFRQLRYSTALSTHLAKIAAYDDSQTLERWKAPHAPGVGNAAAGASHGRLRAVDTDDPEDLLLGATEVPCCASVHADINSAKSLMAIALDGKLRLLALKDPAGQLMAWRQVRLLWDPAHGEPILHIGRLYTNPGVSDDSKQDLLDMALGKATAMGCKLVTSDATLGNDVYAHKVESHDCPWPFEQVDGLEQTQYTKQWAMPSSRLLYAPQDID